jgi:hypothetical protein
MVGLLNLDDASFMAALVVGTNLNGGITAEDAVSAVRVGMADATGLFDVPDRMVESIEAYCESMDTPAGDGVYKLVNTINTRKYAEVLAPMGLTGTTVVTAARRKTFVERLRTTLWPALRSFQAAIKGWTDAWTAQASNPAMLNQIMLTAVTGGGLGALLPQINATPDVAPLRDAHKELVRGVNKLFLGLYRVPVARALAFDAMRIISQIKDPAIAAAAGKTNPEEFVRALNIGVTEHALRTERTLAQYTLNALRMDSIADAQLPAFAAQLALMGASVDWDTLGTAAVSVPAPKSSSSVKYRPYNG